MKLPKEFALSELAQLVGGKVVGDAELKVSAVAMSPLAAKPGELALFFDAKLLPRLSECNASAVVVPEGTETKLPAIVVKRPLLAFQKMLTAIQPARHKPAKGIHPTAIIDETAQIGENVAIGPLVVIGPRTKIGNNTTIMSGCLIAADVVIGENTLLHQGCLIADYVRIGNRVILQQGASIGSDGFSYVTEKMSNLERRIAGIKELSDESNPLLKIPNIGNVIIEDDVEIGSNATIDRATVGSTKIGQGSKIDNLVMIAHNVNLGKDILIVAQSGVGGSCVIGDRVVIAGQTGLKDHLKIGKDAILEAKSALMKDVADGGVVCGIPSVDARDFMNQQVHIRKLPKIYDDFRALRRKVEELEKQLLETQAVRAK